MGQYHYTVNLDKRECINPHKLGDGLKLTEQCGWSPGGTNDALHLLLAVSNGRGGGDFESHELVGRWGGDRIAVVGDYAMRADLPPEFEAENIMGLCGEEGGYKDITEELIPLLERTYEVIYVGDGWCERLNLWRLFGIQSTHGARGGKGRAAEIKGQEYLVDELIAAAKAQPRVVRDREDDKPLDPAKLGVKPLAK